MFICAFNVYFVLVFKILYIFSVLGFVLLNFLTLLLEQENKYLLGTVWFSTAWKGLTDRTNSSKCFNSKSQLLNMQVFKSYS